MAANGYAMAAGTVVVAGMLGLAGRTDGAEAAPAPVRVHSVCDISHEFTFYADGRFFGQYLTGEGNADARNWGTLHKCDLTNVNLLVLLGGATPCPYLPEDIAAVRGLLEAGGGVLLASDYGRFRDETAFHPNDLAAAFGAEFVDRAAKTPLAAAAELRGANVHTYGGKTLRLTAPEDWDVLIRDADGNVVMARRAVGKGRLLVSSRALFGHQPDAQDPVNAEWVTPLLRSLSSGKVVDPAKGNPGQGFDNTVEHGKLKLSYSDYLEGEADAVCAIYDTCMPVLERIMGVPPSQGTMSGLLLLPTGGGGFSSGVAIGLGIWWGDFPRQRYGMVELIGHEGTHSWVLPFAEPMWNESLATYVGALLGRELGHAADGEAVIARCIDGARKQDPEMTIYDLAYGKDVPNAVSWGKTMWLWEEMRRERPDIVARYFHAKRAHVDPATRKTYTPDDCVAVLSLAMERDLFPWFRQHGLTVDRARTTIPAVGTVAPAPAPAR